MNDPKTKQKQQSDYSDEEETEEHFALIVEDDKLNMRPIRSKLEENGFICIGAESVDEAIDAIQNGINANYRFEVIFLDITLKDEKTGIDFLKIRKDLGWDSNGIVVVMSGEAESEIVTECYNYNIQNFLKKPISPSNLTNEIIKIKNLLKSKKCPLKGYKIEKKIGQGATGEVFLVRNKATKEPFALKRIQNDKKNESETNYMLGIKAPNVLELIYFKVIEEYIYMVIEYAEYGTLKSIIEKAESNPSQSLLNEDMILLWMTEALIGLYTIHEKNLIHRDIKTDNLFICKGKILKIGDLGAAKVIKDCAITTIGTFHYMAPEIHNKIQYDSKVDLWSLGVVLYELVMLRKPFNGNSDEIIDKVLNLKYDPFPKNTDVRLIKLLKSLLTLDRNERPSALDLLRLSFIKEYINKIIEENLFVIDDEIISKIMNVNENKAEIKVNKSVFKEEILKSKQFFDLYVTAMKLELNSINRTSYKKGYFSKKYDNVIAGCDLDIVMSDYDIKEEGINKLLKAGYLVNVSNPNEEEFIDDKNNFYQINIFQSHDIDNSTLIIDEFKIHKQNDPIRLTQTCLEMAQSLFERLNNENDEIDRNELCCSKEFFDYLIEIRQFENLDFSKMTKKEKISVVLNVYQVMFIHYYLKLELGFNINNKTNTSGLIHKVKGLVYSDSKDIRVCFNIGGKEISLYELKNIVIRRNKKPFDAYFKLVNDTDDRIKMIEENEKDNWKLLLICLDPVLSLADFNFTFNFFKFGENVNEEIGNYVKEFISNNVVFDENEILIPKFLKNYLCDFDFSEKELIKNLHKNRSSKEKNEKSTSHYLRAVEDKVISISYV